MHQTTRLQPLPGPLDGICHHALNMAITAVLLAGALSSEARAQAFPAVIDLGSLSGNDGFRLDGAAAYDVSGFSVSAAGDINGDGIDDLIVGAPYADPNGSASGSSYVVFGKDAANAGNFPATLALSSLNGSDGFRLDGAAAGDGSGRSVSAAGDLNGDGIDDLIVGAYGADPNGVTSGSSYVVFGKNSPFAATLALGSLSGADGFRLDGAAAYDRSGRSVGAAGDINGDGFGDLLVGAFGADPNGDYSGSSYVVLGKATPFTATLALSSLNGSNGFRLDGVATIDFSGLSVGAAGDINGDGLDDLIVGAPYADPNGSDSGSSYVLFGKDTPFTANLALSSLNGSDGFRLDGVAAFDYAGRSVSAAGDINGDGIDDLIVGALGADPNGSTSGSSYVVFGKETALLGDFPATLALSSLNGSNGYRLDGASAFDRSGRSVSAAGDLNGDGIDDLIVGAFRADPNGNTSGSSYVAFGRDTATQGDFPATLELSSLNGPSGFRLDGAVAFDYSGFSVSAAGDINGDGIDDLIVGAYRADPNGDASGSSYVVFGRVTGLPSLDFGGQKLVDFGPVFVGSTAAAQTLTLSNPGSGRVQIDSIVISNAQFALVGGSCGSLPIRIRVGENCTLDVQFMPQTAGPVLAQMTFTSTSVTSPDSITLFGTGLPAPALSLMPDPLDFGEVAVGASGSAMLIVENTGAGTLQPGLVTIGGADAADFSIQSNGCAGAQLANGAFCTIDLGFAPSAPGPRQATLQLQSNAPSSPDTIPLRGNFDNIFSNGFETP